MCTVQMGMRKVLNDRPNSCYVNTLYVQPTPALYPIFSQCKPIYHKPEKEVVKRSHGSGFA